MGTILDLPSWLSKVSKEAYSSLCCKHHTATGTHVPYGITVLPATRQRWHSRLYPKPIKAGTRFSDPRGMQGWVDLVGLVTNQGGIPVTLRWNVGFLSSCCQSICPSIHWQGQWILEKTAASIDVDQDQPRQGANFRGNSATQRNARLVLGWVTVFGRLAVANGPNNFQMLLVKVLESQRIVTLTWFFLRYINTLIYLLRVC